MKDLKPLLNRIEVSILRPVSYGSTVLSLRHSDLYTYTKKRRERERSKREGWDWWEKENKTYAVANLPQQLKVRQECKALSSYTSHIPLKTIALLLPPARKSSLSSLWVGKRGSPSLMDGCFITQTQGKDVPSHQIIDPTGTYLKTVNIKSIQQTKLANFNSTFFYPI